MSRRPVESLREFFPGASTTTYLNTSVKGLVSTRVRDVVRAHVDSRMQDGGDKPAMFATVERARGAFAELIRARPDEIAMTKNTSEGLNAIATGLPWKPGDNMVLCAALEHPEQRLPLAEPA